MSVHIRIKNKRIYLDIYHAGRRYWESTSLTLPDDKVGQKEVLRLAEEIRRKRELQLVSRKYQLVDPVASKTKLIDYARKIASEYDRKAHINKSIKYLSQYAQDIALNDVDERFVDGYRSFLLKQHTLGERTAQHYLDAFKALLTRAERELLIERNPARAVRSIRAPEHKRPFLTIEEIQRLYNTPVEGELAEQVKKGFLLSCFTGLRMSDIKTLTWGDIEIGEHGPFLRKRQQKTGEVVTVPLAPAAWRLIDNNGISHNSEERVFPRLSASTGVNLHQPLIAWRKRAGITKSFGWHAARHSFAMMTLEASGDVYAVSKLLGHSDIRVTEVYLRMTNARAREIISKLPDMTGPQENPRTGSSTNS